MRSIQDSGKYPSVYAALLAVAASRGIKVNTAGDTERHLGSWNTQGKGDSTISVKMESPTVLSHEIGHDIFRYSPRGHLNGLTIGVGNALGKIGLGDGLARYACRKKEENANREGLKLLAQVGADSALLDFAEKDYNGYIDKLKRNG